MSTILVIALGVLIVAAIIDRCLAIYLRVLARSSGTGRRGK